MERLTIKELKRSSISQNSNLKSNCKWIPSIPQHSPTGPHRPPTPNSFTSNVKRFERLFLIMILDDIYNACRPE